jgi:hypothetical protein
LDRNLDGLWSRYRCSGKEKNSQPLPGPEPPIIYPVAQCYTTELSWLYIQEEAQKVMITFENQNVKSSDNRYFSHTVTFLDVPQ